MAFEIQNELDVFMCNYNECVVFATATAFGILRYKICMQISQAHSCIL